MIFTFLLSNCGLIFAMYPSSVVHTGVKSFGCENNTAHESPIQSWKRIGPSVVSASKSGAVSPSCNAILRLPCRTALNPCRTRRYRQGGAHRRVGLGAVSDEPLRVLGRTCRR